MADLFAPTLADQVDCVRREIAMRERVYPRRVADRKMTQRQADLELARMRTVLDTLLDIERRDPAERRRPGNNNAHPPIPVPAGGFATNEDEARWLEQTLIMRFEETIRDTINVNAKLSVNGLYDLLLMSLNVASRRRVRSPQPPTGSKET